MSQEDKSISIHQPQNGTRPSIKDLLQHPIATIHTQRELALHRAEQSSVARELILTGMTVQLTSYMISELEEQRIQSQIRRRDMSYDGQIPEDNQILISLKERMKLLPVDLTRQDEKAIIGNVDRAIDCLDAWRRIHREIVFGEDNQANAERIMYRRAARTLLTKPPHSDVAPLGYGIDDPATTTMLAAILYTFTPPQSGRDEQVQVAIAAYMTQAVKIFLPEKTIDFQLILVDGLLHGFQETETMQKRLLSLKELLRNSLEKTFERRQIEGPSFED